MENTLKINTGVIRLSIELNGSNGRYIEFNPTDILFAERFYKLISEFEGKAKEYQDRYSNLDDGQKDGNGLPVNMPQILELTQETCAYLRGRIDYVFGEGTASNVFGEAQTMDMFVQFFEGITPFIQNARVDKIKQYVKSGQDTVEEKRAVNNASLKKMRNKKGK